MSDQVVMHCCANVEFDIGSGGAWADCAHRAPLFYCEELRGHGPDHRVVERIGGIDITITWTESLP